MKFYFYKSLRFKITITFSLVFLLIFCVASLFVYRQTSKSINEAADQSLLSRANALLSKAAATPPIVPLPEIGQKMSLVQVSARQVYNIFTSPGFPVITDTIASGKVIVKDTFRIAFAQKLIADDERNYLRLALAESNRHTSAQKNHLIVILALSLLISEIIAALLVYYYTARLLKPLNAIIIKAKSINAAEKMELLDVPITNDELAELSATINAMLKRIESAFRLQNSFFAAAAHELRTPLAIIKTAIDVRLQKPLSADEYDYLRRQQGEIRRLQNLLEDFLLLSQLKHKKDVLHKTRFSLADLVMELAEQMDVLISAEALKLEIAIEGDHHFVEADKEKLRHVLQNLIQNAIKYGRHNTKIDLRLNCKDSDVDIVIRNQSSSRHFKPELLKSEFFKGDHLKDGAGMGLWISEQVLRLHKSTLKISQDNEQFEVSFTLPAADMKKN